MARQGFLESLFDFSFSRFIIPQLVKVLYGLAILGAAAYGIGAWVGVAHGNGILGFLGGAVLGAFVFVVGVLLARLYLEVLIVIFRIAEHTSALVEKLGPEGGAAGRGGPVRPSGPAGPAGSSGGPSGGPEHES